MRIAAGCRIEGGGRDRGRAGMERRELSGQHALIESPVARPQHRSAVAGELRGDAKTRRPDVPRVQRAEAADDVARFRVLADRGQGGPG